MEAISHNGVTIALIVNDDRKLLGILTDGDIRKALLQNDDMNSEVSLFMKTDCSQRWLSPFYEHDCSPLL